VEPSTRVCYYGGGRRPEEEIVSIQLNLPADLEERLKQEASRRGVSPAAAAVQLLDQHLPPIDEGVRRIREAKTLEELFAVADAFPDPDNGYDLLQALDENRKGERPLFPPELKGVSW
jgi:hypothetical protein